LKSLVSKSDKVAGEASAGIPAIASSKAGLDKTIGESQEATYDPFWTHAYTLIQELERNYTVDLEKARIGSLVKFEGFVQLLDMRLMRNVWEPAGKLYLEQQMQAAPQPSTRQGRRDQKREIRQQAIPAIELGLQILREVPHSVHMTFLTASGLRLWSAIQPSGLTIGSEDLTMKYGVTLEGKWTAVGIVDAGIGPQAAPIPLNEFLDTITKAVNDLRAVIGRIYAPLRGLADELTETSTDSTPI